MDYTAANVVALESLLDSRRVWRGQSPHVNDASTQPTGHSASDAQLPFGGGPDRDPASPPGSGELTLRGPTLSRLTAAGKRVVLITRNRDSPLTET